MLWRRYASIFDFCVVIKVLSQAIAELRLELGEDTISTDDEVLHLHGYSEWSSINIDQLPVAVAYPRSTEEVSAIAKVCYKYKMPMSESNVIAYHLSPTNVASSSLFWGHESGSQFFCTIWRNER